MVSILMFDLSKNKSVLNQIRKLESGTRVLEQYFSLDEVLKLKQVFTKSLKESDGLLFRRSHFLCEKSDVTVNPKNPNSRKEVLEILIPKISKLVDSNLELNIDFTFHKNFFPYDLHTDAGYDKDEVIFIQGIIPLEVYPKDKEVYTVIMNQRCFSTCSFHSGSPYWNFIKEGKDINGELEDLCQGNRDNNFYQYWPKDRIEIGEFDNLSIDKAFKWKLGNMAIWNRSRIHGSSDFYFKNVIYKIGLMWCSSLKKESIPRISSWLQN